MLILLKVMVQYQPAAQATTAHATTNACATTFHDTTAHYILTAHGIDGVLLITICP